jgi:hypothetical protein
MTSLSGLLDNRARAHYCHDAQSNDDNDHDGTFAVRSGNYYEAYFFDTHTHSTHICLFVEQL